MGLGMTKMAEYKAGTLQGKAAAVWVVFLCCHPLNVAFLFPPSDA
jgi:hypothetical protein